MTTTRDRLRAARPLDALACCTALVAAVVALVADSDSDVLLAVIVPVVWTLVPLLTPLTARSVARVATAIGLAGLVLLTSVGPAFAPALVLVLLALAAGAARPRSAALAAGAAVGVLALGLLWVVAVADAHAAPSRVVAEGVSPTGTRWRLSAWGSPRNLCVRFAGRTPNEDGSRAWQRLTTCGLDVRRPLGAVVFVDCRGSDTIVYGVAPRGARTIELRSSGGVRTRAAMHRRSVAVRGPARFFVVERPGLADLVSLRALDARGRTIDADPLDRANPLCPGPDDLPDFD